MVLARSNRDIDQKQAIGEHEFTLTPRSLFAPDGTVLPCSDKSKLIHSLQKMVPGPQEQNELAETNESQGQKIAVVDGMVLVQKLYTKSASVNTVKDLSIYFNERLMNITRDYDEIIVAFDTYKALEIRLLCQSAQENIGVPDALLTLHTS